MSETQRIIKVLFERLDNLEVRYFYADLTDNAELACELRDRIDEVLAMLEALL